MFRFWRLTLLLWGVIFAALAGCQKSDEITHYIATHYDDKVPLPKDDGPDRMLAAILINGESAWFFKVTGEKEVVAKQADDVTAFLQSVHFDASSGEPSWQLPDGWKQTAGDENRFATLKIPTDDKPLDLAVSTLSKPDMPDQMFYLMNVNRWRGQMKLLQLSPRQLPLASQQVKLPDDQSALLVNLVGTMSATGAMKPPFAGSGALPQGHPPLDRSDKQPGDKPAGGDGENPDRMLVAVVLRDDAAWFFKITGPRAAVAEFRTPLQEFVETVRFDAEGKPSWKLPDDWQQVAGSPFRFATIKLTKSPGLEIAISQLGKAAGGEDEYLLVNINRWRGQMSLAGIKPEQVAEAGQAFKTADETRALLIDLVGKSSGGGPMSGGPFSGGGSSGIGKRAGAENGK